MNSCGCLKRRPALRIQVGGPSHAFAYYNRSLAKEELGDLAGALMDVEVGRSLAPHDPDFPNRINAVRERLEKQAST